MAQPMFGPWMKMTTKLETILLDSNGSYELSVPKGEGYDFKVFVDGSGNGYPTTGEVWRHYTDWNSSRGGYNLTQRTKTFQR